MTLESRSAQTPDALTSQVPEPPPFTTVQEAGRTRSRPTAVRRFAVVGGMTGMVGFLILAAVSLVSGNRPQPVVGSGSQPPPAAYTGRDAVWPPESIVIDDSSPRALALSIADQLLGTPSAVVDVSAVPSDDPVWLSISLPSGPALHVLAVPRNSKGRVIWRIIQLGDNPPTLSADGPVIRFMVPQNAETLWAVLASETGRKTVNVAGGVLRSGVLPTEGPVSGAMLFFYDAAGSLCGVQAAQWRSA